jgi:hypothetical protein
MSLHPATIDNEYLRGVWRPDTVHAAALRDWESIQAWATEYASQSEETYQRPVEEYHSNGSDDVL